MSYHFLFDLALILLGTKLLGLLTKRVQMPQVVGALLAGLILGPAGLNILNETEFIKQLSEIGVVVLMFTAGLETELSELKKCGKASFIIAMFGVLVPLAGGFAVAYYFNQGDETLTTSTMLQNVFVGIILTATSVSITVETLRELGKLSTRAGNAILGAALIDDILGIIALTIITSFANTEVNVWLVLARIAAFFICAILAGILFNKLFKKWFSQHDKDLRRFVIAAFTLCLLFAYGAEHFFQVADITGAFIAGLIISGTQRTKYIASRFGTTAYMLLSPVFFASIGIQVMLPKMGLEILLFSVVLLIVAVLTKIIGCGIGAKLCRYSNAEAVQIGTGMISRGEVALIVATKGAAVGLMGAALFGPIVIVVVITTIITPVLLKMTFSKSNSKYGDLEHSDLTENYEEVYELDLAEQAILNMSHDIKDGNMKCEATNKTAPAMENIENLSHDNDTTQ